VGPGGTVPAEKGDVVKRGTIDHPKMRMLAGLLGVQQWGAVGILESLWHFTARYAPRGDVGKFPDRAIAAAMGWRLEKAEALILGLIDAGWLEKHDDFRLVVHDWHEHADGTCDTYLSDNGLRYWNGDEPRRKKTRRDTAGHVGTCQDVAGQESTRPSRGRASQNQNQNQNHSPGGSEGDGLEGWKGELLAGLRGTGKFPALTAMGVVNAVAGVDGSGCWEKLVEEARCLAGNVVGNPIAWISKRLGMLVNPPEAGGRRSEAGGRMGGERPAGPVKRSVQAKSMRERYGEDGAEKGS
jgi:hypothetical protein